MKLPLWDDATAQCEHCLRPIQDCSAGLVSVDREFGAFTSDYITCPDCIQTVHFGEPNHTGSTTLQMMREGVQFTRIDWYWWPGGGKHWYHYITPDDANWLWVYAEDRGLALVYDELDRIADTANPW